MIFHLSLRLDVFKETEPFQTSSSAVLVKSWTGKMEWIIRLTSYDIGQCTFILMLRYLNQACIDLY